MKKSRLTTVLLAAVLLVGAANLGAFAATGGPLLLGKNNSASKTTTLKTTGNGAALKLKTKSTAPPLKVNGTGKVKKLNADQVDGKDGEALETTSYSYTLTASTLAGYKFTFPGVPDGRYLATYNISAVTTGSPTHVVCYFYPDGAGGDGIARIQTLLTKSPSNSNWYGSGAGELDMSIPDTYAFFCETDGATITMPAHDEVQAQVVLTRVDNYTSGTRVGGPF